MASLDQLALSHPGLRLHEFECCRPFEGLINASLGIQQPGFLILHNLGKARFALRQF
jgi:hypothetical protein